LPHVEERVTNALDRFAHAGAVNAGDAIAPTSRAKKRAKNTVKRD